MKIKKKTNLKFSSGKIRYIEPVCHTRFPDRPVSSVTEYDPSVEVNQDIFLPYFRPTPEFLLCSSLTVILLRRSCGNITRALSRGTLDANANIPETLCRAMSVQDVCFPFNIRWFKLLIMSKIRAGSFHRLL